MSKSSTPRSIVLAQIVVLMNAATQLALSSRRSALLDQHLLGSIKSPAATARARSMIAVASTAAPIRT
jgi:hypothetical protein